MASLIVVYRMSTEINFLHNENPHFKEWLTQMFNMLCILPMYDYQAFLQIVQIFQRCWPCSLNFIDVPTASTPPLGGHAFPKCLLIAQSLKPAVNNWGWSVLVVRDQFLCALNLVILHCFRISCQHNIFFIIKAQESKWKLINSL